MINEIKLIGNIGKDPEIIQLDNGKIAKFSLATTRKYKDVKETQWHRIVVFGKLADIVENYAKNGQQADISGRLEYDKWEDKEGNKRETPQIIANEYKILGHKESKFPEPQKLEPTQSNEYDPELGF